MRPKEKKRIPQSFVPAIKWGKGRRRREGEKKKGGGGRRESKHNFEPWMVKGREEERCVCRASFSSSTHSLDAPPAQRRPQKSVQKPLSHKQQDFFSRKKDVKNVWSKCLRCFLQLVSPNFILTTFLPFVFYSRRVCRPPSLLLTTSTRTRVIQTI